LEVVTPTKWGWAWAAPPDRYPTVWAGDNLPRNLAAILERRMLDASRAGLEGLPLESAFPASAKDVGLFLAGQTDDARLAEWLWGLMLIDLGTARWDDLARSPAAALLQPISRAYALLKLLFLPSYQALKSARGNTIRLEPSIINHLSAERLPEACQVAARRLRASGYMPLPGPTSGGRMRSTDYDLPHLAVTRLAAALLIPISHPERLQTLVLRPATAPEGAL